MNPLLSHFRNFLHHWVAGQSDPIHRLKDMSLFYTVVLFIITLLAILTA